MELTPHLSPLPPTILSIIVLTNPKTTPQTPQFADVRTVRPNAFGVAFLVVIGRLEMKAALGAQIQVGAFPLEHHRSATYDNHNPLVKFPLWACFTIQKGTDA